MLNMMFGLFDVMTEKNGIYKVTLVLLNESVQSAGAATTRKTIASISIYISV